MVQQFFGNIAIALIAVWHIVIVALYASAYYNYYKAYNISAGYKYTYGVMAIILGIILLTHGILVIHKLKQISSKVGISHQFIKLSKMTNLLLSLGVLIFCIVVVDFLILTLFIGSSSAGQYAINRAIFFILDTYFQLILIFVMGKKKFRRKRCSTLQKVGQLQIIL